MGLVVSWIISNAFPLPADTASVSSTDTHQLLDVAPTQPLPDHPASPEQPAAPSSPPMRIQSPDICQNASHSQPGKPNLHITVPPPETPPQWAQEASVFNLNVVPESLADFSIDEETLSALERIYLYSQSNISYHRIFIARTLPTSLPHVSPAEAIEYVIPLMNGLATDEDESVKEALVEDLTASIWWFLENCPFAEEEAHSADDAAMLSVQSFTPLLGTLLLSQNNSVASAARQCTVDLLARLRNPPDNIGVQARPTEVARQLLEHELIQQVVIGLAHLDSQNSSSTNQLTLLPSSEPGSSYDIHTSAESGSDSHDPSQGSPHENFVPSPASPSTEGISSTHQRDADIGAGENAATPGSPPMDPTGIHPDHPSTQTPGNDSAFSDDFGAHEQQDMGRLASMTLMAAVTASGASSNDARLAFVKEVEQVVHDSIVWVRREAAFAIGALAKALPSDIVLGSLLPLFDAFRHDDAWQVRQSVLFALPALLAQLSPENRRKEALKTVMMLSADSEPAVRVSVMEVLGEVIHCFRADHGGPPTELIHFFIDDEDMQTPGAGSSRQASPQQPWDQLLSIKQESVEARAFDFGSGWTSPEVGGTRNIAKLHIQAFNFPAVALTLGGDRWEELRGFYLRLTQETPARIRRTLAASIGEIANIIGPEQSGRDLVNVWFRFARGSDGLVKSKLMDCLELFLHSLHHKHRLQIFLSLNDIWRFHLHDWHQRETLANALFNFINLFMYNLSAVTECLRVLLRLALADNTAAVREGAAKAYADMHRNLSSQQPAVLQIFREEVQNLANSDVSRKRTTYITCMQALVLSEDQPVWLSEPFIWDALSLLSEDKIVSVRIGVARLLSFASTKYYDGSNLIPINFVTVLRHLSEDHESLDARCFASAALFSLQNPTKQVDNSVVSSPSATFSRPPPPIRTAMLAAG